MAGRYSIQIKQSAQREIRAIGSRKDRERIVARIAALAEDVRPPGSTKLSGREAYRVRQGEYRIVYTVADNTLTVEVVKVGHRREVYR